MPICKSCGTYKHYHARGLCRRCYNTKYRDTHKEDIKEYLVANHDSILELQRKLRYAHGCKPASENRQCPAFLGVHVAEQVLSKVFKDVKKMPYGHKGFDFICNKGKKIDVKSSCMRASGSNWAFDIRKNKILTCSC